MAVFSARRSTRSPDWARFDDRAQFALAAQERPARLGTRSAGAATGAKRLLLAHPMSLCPAKMPSP
jgi:hypothetical protein